MTSQFQITLLQWCQKVNWRYIWGHSEENDKCEFMYYTCHLLCRFYQFWQEAILCCILTVEVLLFVNANFYGSGKKQKFVDSWICCFKVSVFTLNGNLLFVGNHISWFGLPTKTMKIGILQTIVLSQYIVIYCK